MIASLDIRTRADLISALNEAAALEHSVICQYLFTAFSLKKHPSEGNITWPQLERVREWQSNLLLVARQEMEHLGLVCNLLTAIGGVPNFQRPNFPAATPYVVQHKQSSLQRFGEAPMQRFIEIEKLHDARSTTGSPTIGDLYFGIKKGFRFVARRNRQLFIGPPETQVSNATIDLPEGRYDMEMVDVGDLASAERALDQIVEAGDAMPQRRGDSHYERFKNISREFKKMRREDGNFEPARPVADNPVTQLQPHSNQGTVTLIDHPTTSQAADLFNRAYEIMLLMLMRFYAPVNETPQERDGLKRIVFFPLMTMVLRPLGEMLTLMPAHAAGRGETAGPTFEIQHDLLLHPHKPSAWIILHERLLQLVETCGQLVSDAKDLPATAANGILPRLAFLHENLILLARNFERYMNLDREYVLHLLKTGL